MYESRRSSAWNRLAPLLVLSLVGALFVMQPRARAAQATLSMSVVDARTGLLHITATGLPSQTELILSVLVGFAVRPFQAVQYLQQTTTSTGTLDFDDPVGVFMCAGNVQVFLEAVGPQQTTAVPTLGPVTIIPVDTIAQSQPVLAQCPAPVPLVGVTSYSGGVATIAGQGLYVAEMTAITVTSKILGTVATAAAQTDAQGRFTLAATVGTLLCGDVLTVTVTGGAGSSATSDPFVNTCLYPPAAVKPTPTPRVFVPSLSPPTGARLSVQRGAATVMPHHLETLQAQTGVANTLVRAIFLANGLPTVAFTVRADNLGRARVSYMAPASLPAPSVTVQYIISFTVGSRVYSTSGTFRIQAK